MGIYDKMNIPETCRVDKTVFKKLFYENADLSAGDKALFAEGMDKVTWRYCMKPETIHIPPYEDEEREYAEIEVIEVALTREKGLRRMAEVIMRTIPYPMLLVFRLGDRQQFWAAHQRISRSDSNKTTLDELIFSPWVTPDAPLLDALDISTMRFANFFTLYCDLIDAISIDRAKAVAGTAEPMTGEAARALLAQTAAREAQLAALRAELKKETQFNRKLE
ncbi:MAG: DUF4391 domain-containing protein, partial [Ruthenibacterium sp.]